MSAEFSIALTCFRGTDMIEADDLLQGRLAVQVLGSCQLPAGAADLCAAPAAGASNARAPASRLHSTTLQSFYLLQPPSSSQLSRLRFSDNPSIMAGIKVRVLLIVPAKRVYRRAGLPSLPEALQRLFTASMTASALWLRVAVE